MVEARGCVFDNISLTAGDGWSSDPPSPVNETVVTSVSASSSSSSSSSSPCSSSSPNSGSSRCRKCARLRRAVSARDDKLLALNNRVTTLEAQLVAAVDRAKGAENTLRTSELRERGAIRKWENAEEKKAAAELEMRRGAVALAVVEEQLVEEREARVAAEVALQTAEEAVEKLTVEQARARGRDTGRAAVEVLLQGGATSVVRGLQQMVLQLERERDSLAARAKRCDEAEALAATLSQKLILAEARPSPPTAKPTPPRTRMLCEDVALERRLLKIRAEWEEAKEAGRANTPPRTAAAAHGRGE
eukprot:Hpha_TRINITY_DN8070_c0_g1::TRINITY_DN8070_c0_g1_i1::g.140019::m.140019